MAAADRLAALGPFPIEDIVVGGVVHRIPAYAADRWLEILAVDTPDFWKIVPGLLKPDAEDLVVEEMIHDRMSRDDIIDLSRELITIAAGRPWWIAQRLIDTSVSPELGDLTWGMFALRGIDPNHISLARWLDAVYGFYAGRMNPEGKQKFDVELNMPPAGVKVPIDRRQARRNFEALMRSG